MLGATEKGSMWAWSIDGRKDLTLELTVHAEVNCAITHILLRHSKTNVCFVFATEAGQVVGSSILHYHASSINMDLVFYEC